MRRHGVLVGGLLLALCAALVSIGSRDAESERDADRSAAGTVRDRLDVEEGALLDHERHHPGEAARPLPSTTTTPEPSKRSPSSGADVPDHSTALARIRAAWIASADAGAPDESMRALEEALGDAVPGSEEERLLRAVRDDLEALRDVRWALESSDPLETAERQHEAEQEWLEEMGDALRYADDPQLITRALQTMGALRSDEVAGALLDAGRLPERDQRIRRIQLLWRLAADDVDARGGELIGELEDAALSSDARESELARRAIADIEALWDSQWAGESG